MGGTRRCNARPKSPPHADYGCRLFTALPQLNNVLSNWLPIEGLASSNSCTTALKCSCVCDSTSTLASEEAVCMCVCVLLSQPYTPAVLLLHILLLLLFESGVTTANSDGIKGHIADPACTYIITTRLKQRVNDSRGKCRGLYVGCCIFEEIRF